MLNFVQRSALPSSARMKLDNPQPRKHEHKSNSRPCTPMGSLKLDGSACRVSTKVMTEREKKNKRDERRPGTRAVTFVKNRIIINK